MKPEIATKKWNRFFIIIVSLTLFALSCISPFEPNYKGEDNLLVVDGSLIKGVETQVIKISRSSSIVHPKYQNVKYQPEKNCQVKIMDDSGNEFFFKEELPGEYVASINDEFLNYGTQYKLIFSIPGGGNYESGYQKLLKTAPIDSFYSIKENHYDPLMNQENIEGLQFYVDLDAPDDASKYYKWQIEETWENHASHKIDGIWDGSTIRFYNPPSDTLYYCWETKTVDGIYTASTTNLSQNVIKKIPLHFKLSSSKTLIFKYCATVKQFALNKEAYDYWHTKEIELTESGQIYTKQPYQLISNISNTDNAYEKVLGFFWVSSCTLKRIFVENPFNNGSGPDNNCDRATTCDLYYTENYEAYLDFLYDEITFMKWGRDFPNTPPLFFYIEHVYKLICFNFSKDECVDCRERGGTIQKPDFWE